MRSRNAVVALKPPMEEGSRRCGPGKQERRGGIETHPGPQGLPALPGRSRNAVVALKPACRLDDVA